MAKDTNTDQGQPSGTNKPKDGAGIPVEINDDNMPNDQRLTDEDEIADGVRTLHPNRNEDKDDATNIGGYRS